jgi:hypothetical protein
MLGKMKRASGLIIIIITITLQIPVCQMMIYNIQKYRLLCALCVAMNIQN